MAEKMTKAQVKLLSAIRDEEKAVSPIGASATALRILGYAEWNDRSGPRTWWLAITPEGRRALDEASHDR